MFKYRNFVSWFFGAVFMSMFFAACSDDNVGDNENDSSEEADTLADYTVIYWGMAGGNDQAVMNDLYDLLRYRENGKIGTNVNVVGLLKSSPKFQEKFAEHGIDGTMFFNLGKKNGFKTDDQSLMDQILKIEDEYCSKKTHEDSINGDNLVFETIVSISKSFYDNTVSKKVGDTLYPLNSIDSLAAFIKSAAETHPARNYVLLTYGHGSGFNPDADLPVTRACVTDDYLQDAGLSAQNIADAVKLSGVHIQTLFCQNCLMAQLENLPYFQQAAEYAILSSELSTSFYMQEYIANISKAGDNLEKMKEAGRSTIDYYVNVSSKIASSENTPRSHGFYDLSQTGALLSVVNKISSWYADAAEKDPVFIKKVIQNSLYADELPFKNEKTVESRQFIRVVMDSGFQQLFGNNALFMEWTNQMQNVGSFSMNSGIILSHIMYQTIKMKTDSTASLDFNTIQSLFGEYTETLKSMAYIRSTHVNESIKDYPYIFTSPSVCVMPLNSTYYKRRKIKTVYEEYQAKNPEPYNEYGNSLINAYMSQNAANIYAWCSEYFDGVTYKTPFDTMLQGYTSTSFDQQTGWSLFLRNLQCAPSCLTNPIRREYIMGVRQY